MRNEKRYQLLEDLMNAIEAINAEVRIISGEEAMKKLDGLTGIAALFRYKENFT
jgi:stalled ribosome rescue protein Dom34